MVRRENMQEALIPGLPDDLAFRCLGKLSHGYHGLLQCVSKTWRDAVRSPHYSNLKATHGWCGNWLFVLTEGNSSEWIAYDPDAQIWHPLPIIHHTLTPIPNSISISTSHPHHFGFSCVCVRNSFLLIGGSYAQHPQHNNPSLTNHVFHFDPFKQQWSQLASMITPRSHFACCVISHKVYVAGGRSSSSPTTGLSLAEVYDPFLDRWEELPPMSSPQMDCIGLAFKGQFHVLSDQVGLPDQKTSEVLNPLEGTWRTVEDVWPFSRAMQFAVTVVGNDRIYTIVDWGESSIKTRDRDQGEWYNVGSVPPVILPDHARPLEAFGYGFAALGHDLYVVGGKVLKWDESGAGRFDIVKLNVVRICDPTTLPLKWRETRPMSGLARGNVIGCATMEE